MALHNKLFSKILITAFAIALFMASCGGRNSKTAGSKPLTFSPITQKVCAADTTQSYEVYLPTGYSAKTKWPVIYVFDAHGDGKLAVSHFQEAAERFGYIVLGSNNSRNGLQTLEHTLDILLKDARQNYAIDPGRQYTGGFSGGGRVASLVAIKYGNIKGIITCSAGMPGFNPQTAPAKFDIYAIAGREDFNLDEVLAIQQQFANSDWRYVTTAFDGGHAWPPVSYITRAVLWFQLNAMRDGLIPKNNDMLDAALDSSLLYCKQYIGRNQYIRAADECKLGISFLSGLRSTKKLDKKLKEIQEQDAYTEELHKAEQLQLTEQQLKEGFIQSFNSQDINWWKNELAELASRINQETDINTRQMYSRIKGFLGIVCYSFTSKALQDNNDTLTTKYLEIYETLEPQNPDCFYYKALFLDKKGHYNEAVASLKTAIKFGFKEMSKAQLQLSRKTWQVFESTVK
jgi:predicted esterase